MKSYLSLLPVCFFLCSSCHEHTHPRPPAVNRTPPAEPCEKVSWSIHPASTHGYQDKQFDTISIQTFVKNAQFDSLLSTFTVLNQPSLSGNHAYEKEFSFPKEVTSEFDLLIVMGQDSFRITDTKTEWLARMCQSFCGYECAITSFQINGQTGSGSILLIKTGFEYPPSSSEVLISKRKKLKDASNYKQDGWGD